MKMKRLPNSIVYLLLLVAMLSLVLVLVQHNNVSQTVTTDEFVKIVREGRVDAISLNDGNILGYRDSKEIFKSGFGGSYSDLRELLQEEGIDLNTVEINVKPSGSDWGMIILQFALPLVLFGALFYFLFRSARGAGTQALSFGRSRARLNTENKSDVTFANVAGIEEAKEEVQEVVEFLKSPEKFHALGGRIPRGVLLVGPPGTGKTLLAKAIAGEANVPFYSISGSEFVEMFVGVGAARVRDLFERAKHNAPCIIFMDEIDAVGRHRGAGLGGGHDEREQTLNQILSEMDGFDTNTNIIIVAATNRPDVLDPALLRPGRFDRHVIVDLPDIKGRTAILEIHAKNKIVSEDVNMEIIAKETPGFSGADLANLLNEAAILAARHDKKNIQMQELEASIDRVLAGPERKSRRISPREKEITAYHESGHALTAKMLLNADPVHKISIIARGATGGWTRLLPSEDRSLWSRSQFEDQLAISMGGRVAEEINFKEITTGAQNDLSQATKLARKMVTEYGMSPKLGPRTFGQRQELVFLGREISEQRDYSDKVAEQIDEEVHNIIQQAYTVARRILTKNKTKLKEIAEQLMTHETLEGDALNKLFEGLTPQAASSYMK